jgi:hypothetical protein
MRKIIILGIICLFVGMCFQPAFANNNNISVGIEEKQPRGETFYRTFGGTESDRGYSVKQTTDGGYIITGYTESFGTGGSDVWLIKTNSTGNKEWDRTFGGTNEDYGYCVQQTTDNGYIIAGEKANHVWLIKTDSNGNLIWDKKFGATGYDDKWCVQQTTDGGFILTGESALSEVWLIKTNSTGNLEWDKKFRGEDIDMGRYVQQTTDGGYIIVGETWSNTSGIWPDVLLIKTDSIGNMMWEKTFEDERGTRDGGYCVQQTTDGGYIITGYTGWFPDLFVWLLKTDDIGNMIWDRDFGWDSIGFFVQQTIDGGYIITGSGKDLIKTDSLGFMEWDSWIKGTKISIGYCVQQTTDEGYIVTGETINDDVCLIKTNKVGEVKSKAVTGNMLLLRILERFPFLLQLIDVWRLNNL